MLVTSVRFLCAARTPAEFPKHPVREVAFLGRSNAGKSSLMNSLLRMKQLARTSSTPGRTRTINFYQVDDRFRFVDLPGYGWAKVSKSVRRQLRSMAENYLAERKELVLCICVVDSRHAPTEKDLQLKSWLEFHKVPCIFVSTKSDKLSASESRSSLVRAKSLLATELVFPYSAVTSAGYHQVWNEIIKNINAAS